MRTFHCKAHPENPPKLKLHHLVCMEACTGLKIALVKMGLCDIVKTQRVLAFGLAF